MMIDLENDANLEKNGLTLEFKVNHQGQVIENRFSEIPDFDNVRIDTKIESIASIMPEISKVMWRFGLVQRILSSLKILLKLVH